MVYVPLNYNFICTRCQEKSTMHSHYVFAWTMFFRGMEYTRLMLFTVCQVWNSKAWNSHMCNSHARNMLSYIFNHQNNSSLSLNR